MRIFLVASPKQLYKRGSSSVICLTLARAVNLSLPYVFHRKFFSLPKSWLLVFLARSGMRQLGGALYPVTGVTLAINKKIINSYMITKNQIKKNRHDDVGRGPSFTWKKMGSRHKRLRTPDLDIFIFWVFRETNFKRMLMKKVNYLWFAYLFISCLWRKRLYKKHKVYLMVGCLLPVTKMNNFETYL